MKKVTWMCDGCDKETKANENPFNEMTIAVQRKSANESAKPYGPYDLCDKCTNKLNTDIQPNTWTR